MNCRKYRSKKYHAKAHAGLYVYLIGLITVALICGVLIYVSQAKTDGIPQDWTLVERNTDAEDGVLA